MTTDQKIMSSEHHVLSLNLSNYRTVFNDNFGNDSSLNRSRWSAVWGKSDQFSFGNGALTLTGRASEGWNAVGFMQAPYAKTAGEGYGLYQFSGHANAGQGVGICFVMWRADNVWLDKSHPNVATEMDLLESWDKTKSASSTLHYYKAGSSNNGESAHDVSLDLTKNHTYAMDWERGSLTYYVDGKEIYKNTTNAPLDAKDGGSNEVMGAEVVNEGSLVTTPTVQLHITDMSYSTRISSSASASTTASTTSDTVSATQSGSTPKSAVFITTSHGSVTLTAGERLTDTGHSNKVVFPAAGGVTLNGHTIDRNDIFDLRSVMSQTSWDGKTADLGKYLTETTTNGGKDLQVLLHPHGGSASSVLATFTGIGQVSGEFAHFKQDALLK